jgi:hypothetical protein
MDSGGRRESSRRIMPEPIADSQSVDLAEYPYAPQPPLFPAPAAERAEVSAEVPFRKTSSILAILLVIAFAWCDFSIIPLMEAANGPANLAAILMFALMGTIFAQAGLVSLAAVFSEAPFWRRLIGCGSAVIVLWGIWELGFIASQLYEGWSWRSDGDYVDVIRYTGLALPLAAIAIQWPLWFFRLYLGWRLHKIELPESTGRPLSIRDYLIGTAIAALAVTFARLAPPESWDLTDYWPGWLLFFGIAGALSLAFVVPAILLMFCVSDWRIGYCLVIAYGLVTGGVFLGMVLYFDENFRGNIRTWNGVWEALSIVVAFVTFGIFFGAGLKAARNLGFELVVGRTRR